MCHTLLSLLVILSLIHYFVAKTSINVFFSIVEKLNISAIYKSTILIFSVRGRVYSRRSHIYSRRSRVYSKRSRVYSIRSSHILYIFFNWTERNCCWFIIHQVIKVFINEGIIGLIFFSFFLVIFSLLGVGGIWYGSKFQTTRSGTPTRDPPFTSTSLSLYYQHFVVFEYNIIERREGEIVLYKTIDIIFIK